jgi:MoxR-like ATPase
MTESNPIAVASQADDLAAVERLADSYRRLRESIGKVIVGQDDVVEQVLIAVFCRGHALLVGVPGLAKTLLVSTLAQALKLGFKRVQFTPDLMPADITGTDVLEEDRTTGKRVFRFVHGPLFTNLLLADEINRTPPKTQAALLEAMQERQVTAGEHMYKLPDPFFVLATQNPVEQEGTYPLPEAQLDRFLFMIRVGYPTAEQELEIMKRISGAWQSDLVPLLSGDDILSLQQIVRRVPAADHVFHYARDLVRLTRPDDPKSPAFIKEWVQWGAGPRAGIGLMLAAKARAILRGRYHATTGDVRALAAPVLRHRLVANFNAEASGVSTDDIVRKLLETVTPAVEDPLS